MNATVLPSGDSENACLLSNPGGPESVRHCFSPVVSENTTSPNGPLAEQRSTIRIRSPSADQATDPGVSYSHPAVVSFLSVPPRAGTRETVPFWPSQRANAITRPSGDHFGLLMKPFFLSVRRSGVSE